ncbi:B12-binding domain-containing radical SAM protein [Desulfobacula toluolica]|uniref:Cobalamin-binding radical SAM protein n=1 Tax=Desulfobacula toluolica (strain DSM 7467 / Tol2) TaxID=651182 RepID=K0NJK2_DESTT|nr:B12-binding domain-containing radical SAM protein [Desulfobacula toluolica]CCK81681.1 cobalamin-binding radical SAM protein [Desulfobacula toluolica Tol2]
MKIKMVNIENGLQGIGFRKMSSYVKSLNKDTTTYFISPTNQFSLFNRIFLNSDFNLLGDLDIIAQELSCADLLGFSFMSECRDITAQLISRIKNINKNAIIFVGGPHARIYPEDCLNFSDIICVSEGERPFFQFYQKIQNGNDYFDIPGLTYLKKDGSIVNTKPSAPMTNEELTAAPFIDFDVKNKFYDTKKKQFVPMDSKLYKKWLGLNLNIIWTRGCPNKCAYCYNSAFLRYHKKYAQLRHPSPKYMVDEIRSVLKTHPMISWISFFDDGMMALKPEVLQEFADVYSKEIKLPFLTYGTHPNYINDEKVKILVKAGSIFFRMGIQNCSPTVLNIYNRKTSLNKIIQSTRVINKYKKFIAPPAYDIILDNPFATSEDLKEHMENMYLIPRPYVINLHSLRIVLGSALEDNIKKYTNRETIEAKDKNLLHPEATFFNIMHYILSVVKIPHFLFRYSLDHIYNPKEYKTLIIFVRFIFLVRRALGHLKNLDFSFLTGRGSFVPYFLWKVGVLKFYNKIMYEKRNKI